MKWILANKLSILGWTEWLRITAEVSVALVVGGQVFNEGIQSRAVSLASRLQSQLNESYLQSSGNTRTELLQLLKTTKELFRVPKTIAGAVYNSFGLALTARRLARTGQGGLPQTLFKFAILQTSYVFPGGLYGLFVYACHEWHRRSEGHRFYVDRMAAL